MNCPSHLSAADDECQFLAPACALSRSRVGMGVEPSGPHADCDSSTDGVGKQLQPDATPGASAVAMHQRLALPRAGDPSTTGSFACIRHAVLRRACARVDGPERVPRDDRGPIGRFSSLTRTHSPATAGRMSNEIIQSLTSHSFSLRSFASRSLGTPLAVDFPDQVVGRRRGRLSAGRRRA